MGGGGKGEDGGALYFSSFSSPAVKTSLRLHLTRHEQAINNSADTLIDSDRIVQPG